MRDQRTPFIEKYRPRKFEDVVGQEAAVEFLKRKVIDRDHSSLLASGPPGTGKTSLLRIFANAMHCEAASPSPCGQCEICREFLTFDYRAGSLCHYEYNGTENQEKEQTKFLATLNGHHLNPTYSIFIDEVHGLHATAADALLKATEFPRYGTLYMFATTEPENVRAALSSRCQPLELSLLSPAESYRLLSRICAAEGFTYERDALEMLVTAGRGSARDIVKLLDRVSQQGHITPTVISHSLSLGWTSHLLCYFGALLAADVQAQEDALRNWTAAPSRKAKAIRDFLLYLDNYEVKRPALSAVIDIAFHQIKASDRQRIVAGFRARAEAEGLPLGAYWQSMMDRWNFDHGAVIDEPALLIRLRQFDRWVNIEGKPVPVPVPASSAAPIPVSTGRKVVRRSAKAAGSRSKAVAPDDHYLSKRQVVDIYEAASFLPQHHGLWFNVGLDLHHGALGNADPGAVRDLVATLTHELPMRAGGGVHWLWVQSSAKEEPVTQLVMRVPPDYLEHELKGWLGGRLTDLRGTAAADHAAWPLEPILSKNRDVQRNGHWRRVRVLLPPKVLTDPRGWKLQ
jgi:DNA polymerase III subunit gamma/tau